MTDALFTLDPVEFRCAAPDSKKNNMRILRFGRFNKVVPADHIVVQEEAIKLHLFDMLRDHPHFGDHSVRVTVVHHARSDMLDVVVEDLGPRPKGFSGRRRDLTNLTEVLMDAMQGPVFKNDNQIAEVRLERRLT